MYYGHTIDLVMRMFSLEKVVLEEQASDAC